MTSYFGNFDPDCNLRTEVYRRPSKTDTKASSSADSSGDDDYSKLLDMSGNSWTEEINLAIDAANEKEFREHEMTKSEEIKGDEKEEILKEI